MDESKKTRGKTEKRREIAGKKGRDGREDKYRKVM